MLLLWARVNLGMMAMKGYSAFAKAPTIIGASPSDCLMSYLGHSLEESYPSAEMQLVYSAVPANKAGLFERELLKVLDYEIDHLSFNFC